MKNLPIKISNFIEKLLITTNENKISWNIFENKFRCDFNGVYVVISYKSINYDEYIELSITDTHGHLGRFNVNSEYNDFKKIEELTNNILSENLHI